ncbi:MAG: PIN domain-containing protein [Pyrinomonadaceae bacterium]
MNNKLFVDTSFVIGLVNDKDQYHEKALTFSYEFNNASLVTTDAVLFEIGNSLAKDFKQEATKIIKVLRESENVDVITVERDLFDKAFELYQKYNDKDWGLVDCISFVVMREQNITDALTSDKHFVQAGFRALMLDLEN